MRDDISSIWAYGDFTSPKFPIWQVAVFYFESGTRYLSDRAVWIDSVNERAEPLIESWGELSFSSNQTETLAGNGVPIQSVSLSILNVGPEWFSADFLVDGISGVKVEIWQGQTVYIDGMGNTNIVPAIVGTYIVQDNIRHSQGSLTVSVDLVSQLMANDPYMGTLDPATNEYYGISLGALSGVAGSLYGVNPYAKLLADITRLTTVIPTDRDLLSAGFAASGTLEIGVDTINYTGISGSSFTGCSGVDYDADAGQFITLFEHDYVFAFGAGPVDTAGPVYINGVVYNGAHTIDPTSNPVTVTFHDRLPNVLKRFPKELRNGTLIQSSPDAIFSFGPGGWPVGGDLLLVDGVPYKNLYVAEGNVMSRRIRFPGGLPYKKEYVGAVYQNYSFNETYYSSDLFMHPQAARTGDWIYSPESLNWGSATLASISYYMGLGSSVLDFSASTRIRFKTTDYNMGQGGSGRVDITVGSSNYTYRGNTSYDKTFSINESANENGGVEIRMRSDIPTLLENDGVGWFYSATFSGSYRRLITAGHYEYTYYDECKAYVVPNPERESFDQVTINIGDPTAGGVNPADAILGVLSKNFDLKVDEDSFDVARAWYVANGYEFTGFIPGNQRMRKTLLDMCRQSRAILLSRADRLYLKIKEDFQSKPAVQTYLSDDEAASVFNVAKDSISVETQRFEDIVNYVNVRYDASDVQAGYQQAFTVSDAESVSKYKRQDDTFDMYLISDYVMANDVAAFELEEKKRLYTTVTFRAYTEAIRLELDDVVELKTYYSKIFSFTGKVVGIKRKFGSWKQQQMDCHEITLAGYPSNEQYLGHGVIPHGIFGHGI